LLFFVCFPNPTKIKKRRNAITTNIMFGFRIRLGCIHLLDIVDKELVVPHHIGRLIVEICNTLHTYPRFLQKSYCFLFVLFD